MLKKASALKFLGVLILFVALIIPHSAQAFILTQDNILTITFDTKPLQNLDPVSVIEIGWGNLALASISGSPTFTAKLYNGDTLLDTVTTMFTGSFSEWLLWSATGSYPYRSGSHHSATPIDFGPVNDGTFAGKIEVTINQGSIDNILTGNITNYINNPSNNLWDPITIQLISPNPSGGDSGWFAPNINVNPVPVPGAFWLLGSGLIGLVGVGRRKLK